MNRRTFLGWLAAAPVVAPAAVKTLWAAPTSAIPSSAFYCGSALSKAENMALARQQLKAWFAQTIDDDIFAGMGDS